MGKTIMRDISEKYPVERNIVRKFALLVLDNDQGIDIKAYDELVHILFATDNVDIMKEVDVTDDKAYIGEDVAEELMKDL